MESLEGRRKLSSEEQCKDYARQLLPGIEDYLSNVLAKEKLSAGAEKKRQYYLERLDVLKLPPSLPPRPEDLAKVPYISSPFLEQQRALANKVSHVVELTAEDGEAYEDVIGSPHSDGDGEGLNGDLDEDLYEVPLSGQDPVSEDEFSDTSYETYDEDEEENGAPLYQNQLPPLREKPRTRSKRKSESNTANRDSGIRNMSARSLKNVAYCGDLSQKIKNKWQKQFCVILSDGSLLCYKSEKDSKPLLDVTVLGYDVLFMEKDNKRNNVIRLSHPARETYWFSAENRDKTDPWLQVLMTMANSSDISGGSLTGSSTKTEFTDSSSHGTHSHITGSDAHSMTSSEGGSGDGVVKQTMSPQSPGKILPLDKRKPATNIMDSLSNFFSVGRKKGKQMAAVLTIDEKNIDPDAILAAYLQIMADMTGRKWSHRICVLKPGLLQVYKENNETVVEKMIPLLGCVIEQSQDTKRPLALQLNFGDKESIKLDYQDRIEQGRWLTFLIRETRMGDQGGETEYLYVDDKNVGEEEEDVYDDIYDEVCNRDMTEPSITSLITDNDCRDSELLTSITNFMGRGSGATDSDDSENRPPPLPATGPPKKSLSEVGSQSDLSLQAVAEDELEYDDIEEYEDTAVRQAPAESDRVLLLDDSTEKNESSTDVQEEDEEIGQNYENIDSYLESRGIIPIDEETSDDLHTSVEANKSSGKTKQKITVGKLDMGKFPFRSGEKTSDGPVDRRSGDRRIEGMDTVSRGRSCESLSKRGSSASQASQQTDNDDSGISNEYDSATYDDVSTADGDVANSEVKAISSEPQENRLKGSCEVSDTGTEADDDDRIYENIDICLESPHTGQVSAKQKSKDKPEKKQKLTVGKLHISKPHFKLKPKSKPSNKSAGQSKMGVSASEASNVYSKVRLNIDETSSVEAQPTFSSELTISLQSTAAADKQTDVNQNHCNDNDNTMPCDDNDGVKKEKINNSRPGTSQETPSNKPKRPGLNLKLKKPAMPVKRVTLKNAKQQAAKSNAKPEKKKEIDDGTTAANDSATSDGNTASSVEPTGVKPRAGVQRSPVITKESRNSLEARSNVKVKVDLNKPAESEESEIDASEKKLGYIEVIDSDIEEVKKRYSPNVGRKTEAIKKKLEVTDKKTGTPEKKQTGKARTFSPDITPVKFTASRFGSPVSSGSPSATRKGSKTAGQSTAGQSHTNGSTSEDPEQVEVVKCHQGRTIEADKEILDVTANPILNQLRKEKSLRRSFKQSKREKMEDEIAGLRRQLIQIRKKKESLPAVEVLSPRRGNALQQYMDHLQKKLRSQVRSSKLNAADLREKKAFDEELRQLEREYNEKEAQLNKLKTEYEENIFMDSISQEDEDSSLSDTSKASTLPARRSSASPSPSRQTKISTLPATTRNGISGTSSPRNVTPPSGASHSPGTPRRRSEPFTETKFVLDTAGEITLDTVKRGIKVTKSSSSGGTTAVRSKAMNINLREQGAGADRDPSPRGGRQNIHEKVKLWEKMASNTSDC